MLESQALSKIAAELKADGYEVVVNPTGAALPQFLTEFSPDIVAFGPRDNLVVEFSRRGEDSAHDVSRLTEAVRRQPGWHVRFVRFSPQDDEKLPVSTSADLRAFLQRSGDVGTHPEGRFFLLWAALEASARAIDPKSLGRPQTPGRVIAELVTRGIVGHDDQIRLNELAKKRNRLIHGEIATDVSSTDVEFLQTIVASVIDRAESSASDR
jgi:hypothetical protein